MRIEARLFEILTGFFGLAFGGQRGEFLASLSLFRRLLVFFLLGWLLSGLLALLGRGHRRFGSRRMRLILIVVAIVKVELVDSAALGSGRRRCD